jgi:hypothetical protein
MLLWKGFNSKSVAFIAGIKNWFYITDMVPVNTLLIKKEIMTSCLNLAVLQVSLGSVY